MRGKFLRKSSGHTAASQTLVLQFANRETEKFHPGQSQHFGKQFKDLHHDLKCSKTITSYTDSKQKLKTSCWLECQLVILSYQAIVTLRYFFCSRLHALCMLVSLMKLAAYNARNAYVLYCICHSYKPRGGYFLGWLLANIAHTFSDQRSGAKVLC